MTGYGDDLDRYVPDLPHCGGTGEFELRCDGRHRDPCGGPWCNDEVFECPGCDDCIDCAPADHGGDADER